MSDSLLDDAETVTKETPEVQAKPKKNLLRSSQSTDSKSSKSPLKSLLGLKKKKKKDKDDFDWDDIPDTGEQRTAVCKESAEWNAFKEMQERINANLQKTQENLTKLEKSASLSEAGSESKTVISTTSWERFEEEESEDQKTDPEITNDILEVTPNIELGDKLSHLCVSPVPSPARHPDPPQNSRRTSVDDLDDLTNGAATFDLLGLDNNNIETSVEIKETKMANVFSEDLLGLDQPEPPKQEEHPDSGLSSGVVSSGGASPGGANDIFGLGNGQRSGGPSISDQIVDDFLGLGLAEPKKKAPPPRPAAPSPAKVKPARPPPPKHGSFSKSFSRDWFSGSQDEGAFDPLAPKPSAPVVPKPPAPSAMVVPKPAAPPAPIKKDSIPKSDPPASSATNDDDDIFKVPDIQEVLKTTVLTEGADGSPKVQLKTEVSKTPAINPFADIASAPMDFDIFASGPRLDTIPVVIQAPSPSVHSSQEDDMFDPRNTGSSSGVTPVSGDHDVWAAGPDATNTTTTTSEDQTDFFNATFEEPMGHVKAKVVPKPRNTVDGGTDELSILSTPRPRPSGQTTVNVGNLFGDSSTDAFFTQVDEMSISTNPFTDGDSAPLSMNPFADTEQPTVIENTEPPDFDAVFGAEDFACAFKAVGGRSGSEGHVGLGVFDPFQTIHPTSSDEHPMALGTNSDDEDEKMVVTISAEKKMQEFPSAPPLLPPPSKHDNPPRFNPFDRDSSPDDDTFSGFPGFSEPKPDDIKAEAGTEATPEERPPLVKTASEEREELEMALPAVDEDFHPPFDADGWEMLLRQPLKKRLTQNRFWKKCFIRLVNVDNNYTLKIYENSESKDAFHEVLLQPCYALADEEPQQYDAFGKLHTIKMTYVFYKERVGVKAERLTPQNIQNLVRKPRATMILDHAPHVSELMKLGSLHEHVMKSFIWRIEDVMMQLSCFREKTLTYVKDEVSMEVWEEYESELDINGSIVYQKARIRSFCLCFITGMPTLELGINDLRRKGKEIVGRHDIIPVRCDEWIRIQLPEFHACVDKDEFEKTNMIKFRPLDACQFELFRFRISLRPNWELPLQIRVQQNIVGRKIEIRADLLICGYYSTSAKDGQVPCEDIEVRIPIPECWIYMFRVEKGWRYGSIKSATRKPGKIKGFERITMLAQGFSPPSLMEVAVGQAKYEHIHRCIVWRIARLPERHHGAYKTHLFVCRLDLGPHDEVPEAFEKYADVLYTMPNTTVSRTAIRSVSCDTDEPPEKWVRYIAKYKYKVEIDHTLSDEPEPELRISSPPPVKPTSPPNTPPPKAPQAVEEDDRDIPLKSPSSEDDD